MAGKGNTTVIADLDTVVSPNIYVQLDGAKHPLPGDAPSELLLRVTLLSEDLEGAVEAKDPERMLELREEISESVEELFRLRNPALEAGTINLSDGQVGELVAKLFKHYYGKAVEDAEVEEGGERPTEPEAEAPETPQRPRSEQPSRTRQAGKRRRSPRSRSSASSRT
jgi:hypothetical protein